MKKVFVLVLFVIATLNSFASEVINVKTGAKIFAECANFNQENICQSYKIILSDLKDAHDEELSTFNVKPVTDPNDLFMLREKVQELQIMPISQTIYFDGLAVTGGIAAAGMPIAMTGGILQLIHLQAVGAVLLNVGGVMMLGGFGGLIAAIVAPPAVDIVSLPFRALIRQGRIRHLNKLELEAFQFLNLLVTTREERVALKNIKFKQMVKTFRTIKN